MLILNIPPALKLHRPADTLVDLSLTALHPLIYELAIGMPGLDQVGNRQC